MPTPEHLPLHFVLFNHACSVPAEVQPGAHDSNGVQAGLDPRQ